MRILHVITGLQKAAGTSTFCGEVCNQLVALGHDVTIAIFNPKQPNLYPLDPRVHLVSIESILRTPPALSTYSLIHIHGLWTPILHHVSTWAHDRQIPVVWSTHGMTAPWALGHKWWKKLIPWFLYQKHDLKRARMIHCTSDFEVAWNRKLGFAKTFLAPLGTFLPDVECSGSPSLSQTLLFVGRIYPVKALDRLIEAFAVAMKKECPEKLSQESRSTADGPSPKWRLRIVGPDQAGHVSELMSLCEKLGLSYVSPDLLARSTFSSRPQVEFAGPKYGADLDIEYASCTALALVSHTENFGATVVDALAHGKSVITSTNTPWKIVADGGCGWWVDNDVDSLATAIFQLFKLSPSEIAIRGVNGRRLVEEKYTWSSVAKTMLNAYGCVCDLKCK